eukprot:3174918-Prymnesium_polylepis.1
MATLWWLRATARALTASPCGLLQEHPPLVGASAIDRTKYGRSRVSTKSFYTHHTISAAVVRYDAQNI